MIKSGRSRGKIIAPGMVCFALAAVVPCEVQLPASIKLSSSQAEQAADPEAELRTGTALTREGKFEEAVPHLIAARGRVVNEYAAGFNLALCYLGLRRHQQAIEVLEDLRAHGHNTASVNNLLAQAYVGAGRPEEALSA